MQIVSRALIYDLGAIMYCGFKGRTRIMGMETPRWLDESMAMGREEKQGLKSWVELVSEYGHD